MSKYLNLFKTKAEADAAVYDENNTPNVSYCEEDGGIKYTEKILPPPPAWMDMVDLGLPSGLLWAKANFGAESETDYGKYFQWGDTIGYTNGSHSTWKTAPFNNGSSDYNESYFASVSDTVCPNGVLAKEYDAASVNMGGNWRMPTKADFEELITNTTSTWFAKGNTEFNGVAGRKFTSKSDSSKYIFIPAAGIADEGSLYDTGEYSSIWSSSLHTSNSSYAYYIDANRNIVYMLNRDRYYGHSIRAVCSK